MLEIATINDDWPPSVSENFPSLKLFIHIQVVTDKNTSLSNEVAMKWAEVTQSAPDQHAKRAERKVDYILPCSLFTELARDVVMKNNFTPNSNSGNQSPLKLALGK